MSDMKKVTEVTENEKVMTKYDRKVQTRKEQAAKDRLEEIKGIVVGVILLVALAAFVVSFPIRNWMTVNGTYMEVDGEKITPVEYDFNYGVSKNNYLAMYGSFLGMMGITDLSTIESQMYDDIMTYKDYFDQLTVSNLLTSKSLEKMAKAEGFTYDTTADCETMKANIEKMAAEEGLSFDQFLISYYGPLATWERILPYMQEQYYINAYYTKLTEEVDLSEDKLLAEYEADKRSYDLVDYRLETVKAEVPTTAPDGKVQKDENGKEIAYQATEEEIAKAMADAKKQAEDMEKTIAKEGTEYIGRTSTSVNSNIVEFLYDESRKAGDTIVIENATAKRYYVVAFEKRYRNEAPTYDFRMIYSFSTKADTILEEWKAGAATEESFIELVSVYDENEAAANGGLYSGTSASYAGAEMEEWLTDASRAEGDTVAITTETGANMVAYFIGQNKPAWILNAEATLINNEMAEIVGKAVEGIAINDPKKNLDYLYKIPAEESAEESTAE